MTEKLPIVVAILSCLKELKDHIPLLFIRFLSHSSLISVFNWQKCQGASCLNSAWRSIISPGAPILAKHKHFCMYLCMCLSVWVLDVSCKCSLHRMPEDWILVQLGGGCTQRHTLPACLQFCSTTVCVCFVCLSVMQWKFELTQQDCYVLLQMIFSVLSIRSFSAYLG